MILSAAALALSLSTSMGIEARTRTQIEDVEFRIMSLIPAPTPFSPFGTPEPTDNPFETRVTSQIRALQDDVERLYQNVQDVCGQLNDVSSAVEDLGGTGYGCFVR